MGREGAQLFESTKVPNDALALGLPYGRGLGVERGGHRPHSLQLMGEVKMSPEPSHQ